MFFQSYDDLITYIKSKPTKQQQLQVIWRYFFDNVNFDYVMLEHLNKLASDKFVQYIDRLFGNATEEKRQLSLCRLLNSTNISYNYLDRIKKIYLTPYIVDGEERYYSLFEAISQVKCDRIETNGLLRKGISQDFVEFVKKICDDINIPCLIVNAPNNKKVQHHWLDIMIDGEELFYDITYAVFVNDNFNSMGKRFIIDEWLGITPKKLYKNQPDREIGYPEGFSLEYLGLNNLPLCMREFFDKK